MDLSANFENLSDQQKLHITAQIHGYRKLPPTVDEFLESEMYLGKTHGGTKMFPYLKEIMRYLFPTPIHQRYNFIVLTGALGVGKSTLSRTIALYLECKLFHMKDLNYYGLQSSKAFSFIFFHTNKDKAESDFVDPNIHDGEKSPFFQSSWGNTDLIKTRYATDGPRSNAGIGGDVVYYNLSELNFVPYDIAKDKLDTYIKRFDSRFKKAYGYLGMVIVDSSTQGDDSIVDDFIKESPFDIFTLRISSWDAKKHLNMYFQYGGPIEGYRDFKRVEVINGIFEITELLTAKSGEGSKAKEIIRVKSEYITEYNINDWDALLKLGKCPLSFDVYAGDSINSPFIIGEDKELTDKMDKERIIVCPIETYSSFKFNINSALMDIAGISLKSTGKFIQERKGFEDSLIYEQHHPEVFNVDFYDPSDRIIDHVVHQLRYLEKDRKLFVRFDIGVTNDNCGVAISQLDKMIPFGKDSKVLRPLINTPVHFGLDRKPGQETSIDHLHQFIKDLEDYGFEMGEITMDGFASRQLIQNLRREGYQVRSSSVDRTDIPYINWKNQFNNGLWRGCKSDILKDEVFNLTHSNNRVDHTKTSTKDQSDAICGSVDSILTNIDLANEVAVKQGPDFMVKALEKLVESSQMGTIQSMLNKIF